MRKGLFTYVLAGYAAVKHASVPGCRRHPDEAGIADKDELGLTEVEEGEEPDVFWIALGGQEDYGSLRGCKLVLVVACALLRTSSTTT